MRNYMFLALVLRRSADDDLIFLELVRYSGPEVLLKAGSAMYGISRLQDLGLAPLGASSSAILNIKLSVPPVGPDQEEKAFCHACYGICEKTCFEQILLYVLADDLEKAEPLFKCVQLENLGLLLVLRKRLCTIPKS
ncbi:hypothetical protein RB195_015768 [Necator americanus]|uniref:Uncharacterized protein n=1 Tax=Necator americanus TaxID=51031 RepID=A0ABR1E802_NECAM